MIGELTAWPRVRPPVDARVVVLSGAGKVFCAGADAAWMAKTATYSETENIRDANAASAMFRALDELPCRSSDAYTGGHWRRRRLSAVCDSPSRTRTRCSASPK